MITYAHNNFGLSSTFWFTFVGSALPRASLAACVSLVIYFLIYESHDITEYTLRHPYSIGMVASVISFSVIFRSNSAIQRYYEAASVTHQMFSKWGDCATQCCAFHCQRDTKVYTHKAFINRLIHLFSLTAGVSCLSLRQDTDISNIITHIRGNTLPTRLQGSRSDRDNLGLWGWLTYTFGMRSDTSTRLLYNKCSPVPVVGGVSEEEKKALDDAHGSYAKSAVCMFWVTDLITTQYNLGAFGHVTPPIVSRLYQELSDGMLGFNQARKIAYLPFPFIYAQGTEFLMGFGVVLIPLLMNGFVEGSVLGGMMTFFTCTCFFVLYEACRELEDPFLYEPNDLPLLNWTSQFNEMLLSIGEQQVRRELAANGKDTAHPSHIQNSSVDSRLHQRVLTDNQDDESIPLTNDASGAEGVFDDELSDRN